MAYLCKSQRSAIRRLMQRNLVSREKLRVRRGGKLRRPELLKGKVVYVRAHCPALISVVDWKFRSETLNFLSVIRNCTGRDGVGVHLVFSDLERAHSNGMVFLIAEIDRLQRSSTMAKPIICTRSRTPLMEEVLKQVGVYEMVGVSCPVTPKSDNVVHWRKATGVLADGQTGSSVFIDYQGRMADALSKGLYAGMAEAMTNTVHHAYTVGRGPALSKHIGKRWWMLSQQKDNFLSVAICDLGVGIPESLPSSKSFARSLIDSMWDRLGLDRTDSNAIKVAIELGKTRTNRPERGKGLTEIVKLAEQMSEGKVLIGSNKGLFTSGGGNSNARENRDSIRGTLIQWHFPIDEVTT